MIHVQPQDHTDQLAEPTTVEKLNKIPFAIGFEASNAVFVHLVYFGSAFVLFLNALGFSKSRIGFLLSLLPFLVLASLFSRPIINRLGNKRTFLVFWTSRTLVTTGLLAIPLVLSLWGVQVAFYTVAAVTASFAILKAIGQTGLLPWQQEYIPNQIRGKFSAYANIATSITGLLSMLFSGFVLDRIEGLNGYTLLFCVGLFFALVGIGFSVSIPGGAPKPVDKRQKRSVVTIFKPLRDRQLLAFLAGSALVTLSAGPLGSFLPLYMDEKIGLSTGNIVYLGVATLFGGILSGYFWGWAADRYGSRPVMLFGLLLKAVYPVLIFVIPHHTPVSMAIALAIYFYGGVVTMGWTIGSSRLLFTNIVPRDQAPDYSAIYHSWLGLAGGISALAGGWILDTLSGYQRTILNLTLDSYTILFGSGIALAVTAILFLRRIKDEPSISVGDFAGLFYHGKPLMAMESMIRFHRTIDEPAVIAATERLGQSHSPLTIDELLEALADPRFLVRFEALVSIGRHGPDERLRLALVKILNGADPAMSVIAAWALGRMRDPMSLEPLRSALDSPYRSVRAHAARSLAGLQDLESISFIADHLKKESDPGLKSVYAICLARLDDSSIIPDILGLLRESKDEINRNELALALARLIGRERVFIQLTRKLRQDPGTTLYQAFSPLSTTISATLNKPEELDLINKSAHALARNNLAQGLEAFAHLLKALPETRISEKYRPILAECHKQIHKHREKRLEYTILALLLLQADL